LGVRVDGRVPDQKGATIMASPAQPADRRPRLGLRLTSGLEVLDNWSRDAAEADKNLVDRVLFAIVDGSVFVQFIVVDDVERAMEFFVLARFDLTVKVRLHGHDAFGIVYAGPTCSAPGFDRADPQDGSPETVPGEAGHPRRDGQSTPHCG